MEFYASLMNLKKDKSNHKIPKGLKNGNDLIGEPAKRANEFNKFFATFSAGDEAVSIKECSNFVLKNFRNVGPKVDTKPFHGNFSLRPTSVTIMNKMFDQLNGSTSAGISDIPVKIIKAFSPAISAFLADLNLTLSLQTRSKPTEQRQLFW